MTHCLRELGRAEQRELLLDAFTRTAAERGYSKTDAEEVARRAGVSHQTFYMHFPDMRQCMSAAYDAFVERLTRQAKTAADAESEWPEKVRSAIGASIEFLVETASRARVFAVEAASAGPLFLEHYYASIERAADQLQQGRPRYPRAAGMPDCTESVLVAGVVSTIRAHLLAEEDALLPHLEPEFVAVLLAPYLGVTGAHSIASSDDSTASILAQRHKHEIE